MCGIAGIVRARADAHVEEEALLRMAAAIRHRGPDGFGIATDPGAGFVSTRLAIVDLPCGWQPLEAEAGGDLLVYNGEVYNHIELRDELRREGVEFETASDTEVILRLLVREGVNALDRLNGQFAFAWWQPASRRLTLVRDRFGVRPLHFSLLADGSIVFGSEAKALFASREVAPRPDLAGLDDVFTTWGPRAPTSPFDGVDQLKPGALLVWQDGAITARRRWWTPEYGETAQPRSDLLELLEDSVDLRLRADVPVGAYLSGGLDSSLISALAQRRKRGELRTFSIAFKDPRYDERAHQEAVAKALGTQHHVVEAGPTEIARALPEVIRHAETPLIRTAPVPMFLLAREVRAHDLTVVITGEGADELFWGYDLFKEVAIRELHSRDPDRALAMLADLYPYLGETGARRGPAFTRFLLETGSGSDPLSSHLTRAEATATVKAFYRPEVAEEIGRDASLDRLRGDLPGRFGNWSTLERAAWLEVDDAARAISARARRGTGWRWRVGWRGAIRFSTTVSSRTRWRCHRRRSSMACGTRSRCARSPRICSRPRSWSGRSSPTERPRWRRSSPRMRPTGSTRLSAHPRWRPPGSGIPQRSKGWFGGAGPGGRREFVRGWRSSASLRRSSGTREFCGTGDGYPAETERRVSESRARGTT